MVHVEINTEPVQDPPELTELRAEVGKLNTEKEAWSEMEQQLRESLAQSENRVAHALQPQNGLSAMNSPTDHAATGDTHVKNQVNTNVYSTNVVVPPHAGSNGCNGWNGQSVDLGVDTQNGAVCVEAVVGQAQLAMRALADMARGGHLQKEIAENLLSELHVYRRLHNAGEAWPQQPVMNGHCPGYYTEMVPMQWIPQPMNMQQSQSTPPMNGAANGYAATPHPRGGTRRGGGSR
jgi:hypothetical protein